MDKKGSIKQKHLKKLLIFKGYTVDFRLKQFRKVNRKNLEIEFVDFDSEKGRKLLSEFKELLKTHS